MIRALVVDDEPLARKRMRSLLRDYEDVTVAGEAADGAEAIRVVAELEPDVVFLDVQMPELDGFEVVRRLEPEQRPLIVFVTAFEQYALDAFRASAVQYLLKPVDRDELHNTIVRVRRLVATPVPDSALNDLLQQLQKPRDFLQRIVINVKGRTLLFRVDQIDWFESAGNYVRLHVGHDRYLLRETMSGLEEKLDPQQFVRIHRSAIVNLERVREMQPTSHGEYTVTLIDDTRLTLSRVYRERIKPLLGRL
ncbi:MAG TPA: LytTR family DNA-binding domain-containing protein [Thermoanaerobaculia bacterium]|nr:LytTR family DNA-binding domain-containing protein [Thermoanaerobaculia bacterium]